MEKNDNKFLFNRKDIADIFQVDGRAVSKWVNDQGCPVVISGTTKKYDIREVVPWRIKRTGNFNINEDEDISKLSVDEQSKIYYRDKLKAQSELESIKVKIQKGEYILKSEVVQNVSNCLVITKKSLMNLTNKIMNTLINYIGNEGQREVATEIDGLVKDCLNNLSQGLEYKEQ